ncbi:MAG: cobaltochelatase subunit CobN [bacterium]
MKLFSIMWSSYIHLLKSACEKLGIALTTYSTKQLEENPSLLSQVLSSLGDADLILFYRTASPFWEEIDKRIKESEKKLNLVITGSDPTYWFLSPTGPEIAEKTYTYLLYNGRNNILNMLRFLINKFFDPSFTYEEPEEFPWEGIFHPSLPQVYNNSEEYLNDYLSQIDFVPEHFVGLLYLRSNLLGENIELEKALIYSFEKRRIGVLPVFYYSLKDEQLGNLSGEEAIDKFMIKDNKPLVDCVIRLSSFPLRRKRHPIAEEDYENEITQRLNIPLFSPLISYNKNEEEWEESPDGLGKQIGWSLAIPEFEGAIEPIIIATKEEEQGEGKLKPISERVEKFVERVTRWVKLQKKPNSQRKVAFILHNNPCASVEATVGGGAHLDTLQSLVEILKKMKSMGYEVEVPQSGRELIEEIMEKKAISEFRWTTVEEIVNRGGALALIPKEVYEGWFRELPERTRERMIEAWGNPPGEFKDGVPPAMVYNGKIVVTGIRKGNAVICVQPKRGCAGSRCDGKVCKILHDPDVPPPHQYLATYRWLSRVFQADVIIHIGTHGNLEFLPGKANALSPSCFPDICIDNTPHLYIYNSDNPPEGTIAKRRSYAVLVDHMQVVMKKANLYGELRDIEEELKAMENTQSLTEDAKEWAIFQKAKDLGLLSEIKPDIFLNLQEIRENIETIKSTFIPDGMHIFGHIPEGDDLVDMVFAIMSYDNSPSSLKALARRLGKTNSDAEVEELAKQICSSFILEGKTLREIVGRETLNEEEQRLLSLVEEKLTDVIKRIKSSDEIGSLLNGMKGGAVPPGPSGLILRGEVNVLPTGRNFYSLDPRRIPKPSAWETGKRLAEGVLKKYLDETNKYPESIAFYWQAGDIMWAGGEVLSQMLYLLGVRPIWRGNGQVEGLEVIPLQDLKRPRIDITVRVSGITRDNFPQCIELLDEAITTVASLEEPADLNYVRKHTLERMGNDSSWESFRKATLRVFASMPGTYQAGTQLAVYASAWRKDKDLADVFIYWNGYSYGKGIYGEPAHNALKENLKKVEVTFNNTISDEYDLTGCCCYFGTHGGLINVIKVLSPERDVKNYYGDTREMGKVVIRTLSEEIRRVARAKILNPQWIEGMKRHGYKGASEIMKRVGRLYGWQATAKAVDNRIFDDVAKTFLLNEENRRFFQENNPWAMEEIGRRLLEAKERGLWTPSPEVAERLEELYLEIEGWIEERMEGVEGSFQGGSIDVVTPEEVENWRRKLEEVLQE